MPASAWHGRRTQLCTGEPGNAEEEPAVEPGNCASCAAERSGRVEAEPEEVRASSENAMGHWRSYRDRGVETGGPGQGAGAAGRGASLDAGGKRSEVLMAGGKRGEDVPAWRVYERRPGLFSRSRRRAWTYR